MKLYSFPEVLVIKQAVTKQFGLYLHFHEACTSQYFSFDESVSEEVQNWIAEYFKADGLTVRWTQSGDAFSVH